MPLPTRNNENETIDYSFRFRCETLRSLMNNNVNAFKLIKDLEADLNHMRSIEHGVKKPVQRLINRSFLMAQELNLLTQGGHTDLYNVLVRIKKETDQVFARQAETKGQPLAISLDSPASLDEGSVGGKAFGVALLKKYFKDAVPAGFVITAAGYNLLLEKNNLADRIRLLLSDLVTNQDQLKTRTATIRGWIKNAQIPDEINAAISEYAGMLDPNDSQKWAVRASLVCQDGSRSFAGLFESRLAVQRKQLAEAYLDVLASRFSDNAVQYRLNSGLREIKTPMAVLFSTMVDASVLGTIQIQDEKFADKDVMIVNAASGEEGPGIQAAAGISEFHLSLEASPALLLAPYNSLDDLRRHLPDYISEEALLEIGKMGWAAKEQLGYTMVIDWVLDNDGHLNLLQTRRHDVPQAQETLSRKHEDAHLLATGGVTIFQGRAEGNPVFLKSLGEIESVQKGDIVIVEKTDPKLATILPVISALLVVEGMPSEPFATLVRESAVPAIFKLGKAGRRLIGKNYISVNATKRKIYDGSRWPGMRERVLARIAGREQADVPNTLYNHILKLNLTDPDGSTFKGKFCDSIHDATWLMYEMSVRSMFGFGDQQKRGWKNRSCKLKTDLPLKFQIIGLDDSVVSKKKTALPEDIACRPFIALWEGIADKNLHWPERWEKAMLGLPSDFTETVLGGGKGPRRSSDTNYAIAAKDYINLNARLSYHYLMVDSIVGPGSENNHIHFRFRGGGGSDANRSRCVSFLETVLRRSGFGVDRKGDIVNAWMMCYPQPDSEDALKLIGRLIVCARELDAVLEFDKDVEVFAKNFLSGNYTIFA